MVISVISVASPPSYTRESLFEKPCLTSFERSFRQRALCIPDLGLYWVIRICSAIYDLIHAQDWRRWTMLVLMSQN